MKADREGCRGAGAAHEGSLYEGRTSRLTGHPLCVPILNGKKIQPIIQKCSCSQTATTHCCFGKQVTFIFQNPTTPHLQGGDTILLVLMKPDSLVSEFYRARANLLNMARKIILFGLTYEFIHGS